MPPPHAHRAAALLLALWSTAVCALAQTPAPAPPTQPPAPQSATQPPVPHTALPPAPHTAPRTAAPTTAPPAAPARGVRSAFRTCDGQAFLALSIARNYLMSDRNRGLVMPLVERDAAARAMAEELFDRVEQGTVRHPGQFAADVLFRCAADNGLRVGATPEQAAVCFTRTDVAVLLHGHRSRSVPQQKAVADVAAKLTARELYPMSLISQTAEAVYRPPELPDLQRLTGAMAWGCIQRGAGAPASGAGR